MLLSSTAYTFCELFAAADYATNLTESARQVMEESYPGTQVAGDAATYACDDDALAVTVSLRTYGGTGLGVGAGLLGGMLIADAMFW